MRELFPIALIVFLLAISGCQLWTRRSLRFLSVEQKALVLDSWSQSNIWLPVCLAVFAGISFWLPSPSVPAYYRLGVLASYALVPFLLSVAASMSTLIRLSRLSLPPSYLRHVRIRAIVFHVALLLLIGAFIYTAFFMYSRRREQLHLTSNHALQLTASRRTTEFSHD